MELTRLISSIVNDPVVIAILSTFTVLYTSTVGPTLPQSVKAIFANEYFRVVILFIVAYMSSARKPVIAIVSFASFFLITNILAEEKLVQNSHNS